MRQSMLGILMLLYKTASKTRYAVKIKGLENMDPNAPTLIFPNHTALIDSQIILSHIWRVSKPSPVANDKFAKHFLLKNLFDSLNTVVVKDMSFNAANLDVGELLNTITKRLQQNEHVVLYPEGEISGAGYARIRGKKMAHLLARQAPENTKIILISMHGLWGSMFSRAWKGENPNLFGTYAKALLLLLFNLIFFMPKRELSIEIVDKTDELKNLAKEKDMLEFNAYLQEHYNKGAYKEPRFVPWHFAFRKQKVKPHKATKGSEQELSRSAIAKKDELDQETLAVITNILHQVRDDTKNKTINFDTNLILDLYFDSIDIAEAYRLVKEKFNTKDEVPLHKIKTVTDLVLIAKDKFASREPLPECSFASDKFKRTFKGAININPNGNIVGTALKTLRRNLKAPFLFDQTFGTMTRFDFLLKAHVVSQYIKKNFKGDKVGIMLPASSSATLLVFATLLAGKTPVMFNWTASQKAQEKTLDILKGGKVLTATKLYEKTKENLSPKLQEAFIFADKELKQMPKFVKIAGALKTLWHLAFPVFIASAEKEAVILFTSGTESLPKTVPLTQKNIVSNLANTFKTLHFDKDEILLSFLPPFHSFGFTVGSVLPLLSGIRVAYTPDPNDSFAIANMAEHTKASILISAPSFLKNIFKEDAKKLQNIKTIISGAEKCPPGIMQKAQELGAQILEGYGITECSPVVSVNPKGKAKPGSVGVPICNLDVAIVKDGKKLEAGEMGLICIHGPSVFKGYKEENKNPFVELDGKKYYDSGDLGFFDKDGYLHISGRLKRFVKISGEMISLPQIEEVLRKLTKQEGDFIAVEALEKEGSVDIYVFTNMDIVLADAQNIVQNANLSKLIKIKDVVFVKEAPLLGSGKIDYRALKQMLNDRV